MEKKSRISDIIEKLLYETEAEFNTKIKCITVLPFLPFINFINGFIHLTDDDNLL